VRICDHARSKSADFARNAKTGSAPKKFGHVSDIEKITPLKFNGESLWQAKNNL
jgi:hypothetical protein